MGLVWYRGVAVVLAMMAGATAQGQSPKETVEQMIVREKAAAAARSNYIYTATERSERTGGHLWTERIVETPFGRVRRLLFEDGTAISADRARQEHDRLANDATHPDAFIKREKSEMNEEAHGRQILEMLPKGFFLENMREQDGDLRIDYRPNPAYSPTTTEEKILHGMSGYLLIDRKEMRLHYVEGRLPADLGVGFGLVNVKAGSYFLTQKAPELGQWRTVRVVSDVRAKAILLKSISRNQNVERKDFERVPDNLTVAQAVVLVEK